MKISYRTESWESPWRRNIVKKHDDFTVCVFDFVKEKQAAGIQRAPWPAVIPWNWQNSDVIISMVQVRAFQGLCTWESWARAGFHQDLHRHEHHIDPSVSVGRLPKW